MQRRCKDGLVERRKIFLRLEDERGVGKKDNRLPNIGIGLFRSCKYSVEHQEARLFFSNNLVDAKVSMVSRASLHMSGGSNTTHLTERRLERRVKLVDGPSKFFFFRFGLYWLQICIVTANHHQRTVGAILRRSRYYYWKCALGCSRGTGL